MNSKELSYSIYEESKLKFFKRGKIKKLKEALDLYEGNIDARLDLIRLRDNSFERIKFLLKLLNKNLNEDDLRRVYIELFHEYDSNGLYGEALGYLKKVGDGKLIKLMVFSNLVKSFSKEEINSFIKNERDLEIRIVYLIYLILINENDRAYEILKNIVDSNREIYIIFRGFDFNYREMGKSLCKDMDDLKVLDWIYISLSGILPLIYKNSYVFFWVKYHLGKALGDNNQGDIYNDIRGMQLNVLRDMGLETFDDFLNIREEDLLDKKYIGKKTLEKLKENGVKFSE